jgi:hypothetical protein
MAGVKTVIAGKRKMGRPRIYATEAEYKAAHNAQQKKWYEKNKEKFLERQKLRNYAHYQENKEALKEKQRAYYHANRKAVNLKNKKRWVRNLVEECVSKILGDAIASEVRRQLSELKLAAPNGAEGAVTREEFSLAMEDIKGLCEDVAKIEKHLKWGPK